MEHHETLGMIVKKSRQNKKLRQIEVSKSASISRNYLSDIENDRYTPSLKTFIRLASVLELDLNLLTKMTEIQVKYSGEESKCTTN
ncbi:MULTISPECIES: helix-turn-helix domain-containing protein [unclassified Bacillus (in: firmicutes)]|uniref:helix-turn-helix domain-containing protein n=1 Tax=unclassified Bacillus (in: firmicutes) TaxID=185979 RepID=UPI0008F33AB4|nr:helix-turn-helix transcriptional regulator [Bacillus sp. 71mf]SFI26672.1 Helix-turn-helix [Bacillus sp. 71mf]SFS40375.1 Helix-turn-helix [Bacillus sp. 103mf]